MDRSVRTRIANSLTAHQNSLNNFCARLVQTPSVNGVHPERAVADLLAAQAREFGLWARLLAQTAQRPNVLISTPNERPIGLILVGHLDTVPAGQVDQWTHHPFSGRIVGNTLFGRGAIDSKGGLAAALYALAALKACNLLTKSRAQLICVPDEESGATGTLGVKFLNQHDLII